MTTPPFSPLPPAYVPPVLTLTEKIERIEKEIFAPQEWFLDNALAVARRKMDATGPNGEEPVGSTPESIVAYAATGFIAAQKKGWV